jgi:hypothetical protein
MHASELFGARLDNHVQRGAALFVLSASVAFVALSPEAEYEYGCVIRARRDACKRVGDLRAPKAVAKPAVEGLMAMVHERSEVRAMARTRSRRRAAGGSLVHSRLGGKSESLTNYTNGG